MAPFRRAQRHRPVAVRSPEYRRREAERIRIQNSYEAQAFWFRLR
jgi:hypothetical protein